MKKMELTEEQIADIAQDLDSGKKVYWHTETKEIKSIIDSDSPIDDEEEEWENEIGETEDNYDEYVIFERMSTNDSYHTMKDFADTLKNNELRKNLDLGLSLSNPLRNFQDIIDGSGDYKENWIEFKIQRYTEYIKEKMTNYNNELQ